MGLEHVRAPLSIIWAFLIQSELEERAVYSVAPLNVRTEILPSDEAQARMAPSSWGAHDTELTGIIMFRVKGMDGASEGGSGRTRRRV
jgi:hypothetical protein